MICENGYSKYTRIITYKKGVADTMKRSVSISVLLVMLTLLLCVPAAAPAETQVTLKNTVSYDKGYTKISWDVSGEDASNYIVIIQPVDNGDVDQQMVKVGETTKHSIKSVDMIPGKSYKVMVMDNIFRTLAEKVYTMPDPVDFKDGKMTPNSVKISLDPVSLASGKKRDKSTKKVKNLKVKDIEDGLSDDSMAYGLKYTMKMPQLKKAREFFVTIAFESPEGFLSTVIADDLTFDRVNHGYQTIWFYMIGDAFFSNLYKTTGKIEKGKYKIHLFWDGMWVNTSTFKVSN